MKKSNVKELLLFIAVILIFGCKIASKSMILPKFVSIGCPVLGLVLIIVGLIIGKEK